MLNVIIVPPISNMLHEHEVDLWRIKNFTFSLQGVKYTFYPLNRVVTGRMQKIAIYSVISFIGIALLESK